VYLVFDGPGSVVHVVSVRQQVQNWAFPLEVDAVALFGLEERKRRGRGGEDQDDVIKP